MDETSGPMHCDSGPCRESALGVIDGMIAGQERRLAELKHLRKMMSNVENNSPAECLLWHMLANLRGDPRGW